MPVEAKVPLPLNSTWAGQRAVDWPGDIARCLPHSDQLIDGALRRLVKCRGWRLSCTRSSAPGSWRRRCAESRYVARLLLPVQTSMSTVRIAHSMRYAAFQFRRDVGVVHVQQCGIRCWTAGIVVRLPTRRGWPLPRPADDVSDGRRRALVTSQSAIRQPFATRAGSV